ncbi:MAG: hypothetical protein C5B50_05760 [Verrucomicrobia bacterium]|nr:MAG: hypothetical protein C5B50_05760 [Verrucomicrobiota bacterium]
MDQKLLEKLRQKQGLVQMPDGSEGVPVTLQFKGEVPAAPRPERKRWLINHFCGLGKQLANFPVMIDPDSVSVSGQTVEAVCPTDRLSEFRAAVEPTGHRVDVLRTMQAVPEVKTV